MSEIRFFRKSGWSCLYCGYKVGDREDLEQFWDGHRCPVCGLDKNIEKIRDMLQEHFCEEFPHSGLCKHCTVETWICEPLFKLMYPKSLAEQLKNKVRLSTPKKAKVPEGWTSHSCEYLLEDNGCDLGQKDGCEYTTPNQKCGILLYHNKYADMMESSEKRRRMFGESKDER